MSTHHAGPMPARSTATLTISWGLVQLPVSIYAGTDKGAAVTRKEFTADAHAVGRKPYDKVTGEDVTGDDVIKMAEAGPDHWIVLTDEEIELATGGVEKGLTDIVAFVPLSAIGNEYVVTDVNQVRPNAKSPGSAKPFVLLCEAMRERKVAALVKVALRSVAKYAVITPDGQFLQLAYNDQVRPAREMPTADLSDAERALADTLIDTVGVDTPVLVNETAIKVQEYVMAKAAGGEVLAPVVAEIAPAADTSLEAMLAAAVAAERAKREPEAAPKPKRAKKAA